MIEETKNARLTVDELIKNARMYSRSADYQELLDFISRLRNIAPFNALLLHIQKPGIRYAASEYEWNEQFNRKLKPGARPLIIMWPFSPVAWVYDADDTEGEPLPKLAFQASFTASGAVDKWEIKNYRHLLSLQHIDIEYPDAPETDAGAIRHCGTKTIEPPKNKKDGKPKVVDCYLIRLNKNHSPAVQFSTLAHELGHLFLGHLGNNKELRIKARGKVSHEQQEFEAESLSYLVCTRHGVSTNSERYLAQFVSHNEYVPPLDLYHLMTAAGAVERILQIGGHIQFRG